MRILLVSKFRKVTGGVETHLHELRRGLENLDHQVFLFGSEDVGAQGFDASASSVKARAGAAQTLLWSRDAKKALSQVVANVRPDVVHFHSIYHQLSPSVLSAFEGPSVMTLHDYKLAAPCYSLLREGEVCQLCVGKAVPLPAIRHRCVQDSSIASALCVVEAVGHRRRYSEGVDQYIVPSRYAGEVFTRSGILPDRVNVVGWGVEQKALESKPVAGRQLLFLGRLDASKGIDILIDSFASIRGRAATELTVAGDGPLQEMVITAAANNPAVRYVGWLDQAAVVNAIAHAAAVVIPSKAPETFGLSAVEALLLGTPVIHSGRGALSEHDGPGVINVGSTAVEEWERVLSHPGLQERLKDERRSIPSRDLGQYSRERMARSVVAVYERAIASFSTR